MSNFRAVATVTATLQNILQAAIQADVPGATVTTVRPGADTAANLPTTGLNLFLYQVGQSPHRINDDVPTRSADGVAAQRPVVPIELYYLMSCYGDDRTLEPQRVLGSAFAFLHAQPQLTRAQIQAVIADPAHSFIAGSDLANQFDLIRFTPINLTLDELSRLWSVFLQTQYVLSTTFKASTVLLERAITPRPALPARAVQLVTLPLRTPRIDAIVSASGDTAPITAGGSIVVEGADLLGDATIVEIDGTVAPTTTTANDRIVLPLPAGIAAGPHTLQVRQGILVSGTDTIPRPAFASGLAAFAVQPVITKTAGAYNITIANVQGTGTAPRSATVTISVAPAIGVQQTTTLEMLSGQQVAYRFLAQPLASAGTQLVFQIAGVAAGGYIFQVRIDGAASPLDLDASGAPTGPKGTIP
jgi:hypothetical protein